MTMKLKRRETFRKAPEKTCLMAFAFYTQPTGLAKKACLAYQTRSDLTDFMEVLSSADNGKTWAEEARIVTHKQDTDGVPIRRRSQPSYVDPVNGYLITIVNEARMPNDDPIRDGLRNRYLKYQISIDGGKTNVVDKMIIQEGFSRENPMRGVTVGKNTVMIGDNGCETIRTTGDKLLVPLQVCPVDDAGNLYNPGGGYTYHDAAVLIGEWIDHNGTPDIKWDLSPYISNDPEKSTRGALEPTIAQFADGRILMVLRGSNSVKQNQPGHKWYSISSDEGQTWDEVKPWTYADGTSFFSPSSMSQLLKHSSGEIYWLGNISENDTKGNSPRYPIVIGRVCPETLLLDRDTVFAIDTRKEDEWTGMTLSNFHAHEDRENGDVLLHLFRWLKKGPDDLAADALLYRIGVG